MTTIDPESTPPIFNNEPVDLGDRPRLDDADIEPLDPRLLQLRTMMALMAGILVASAGLIVAVIVDPVRWVGLVVVALSALGTVLSVVGTRVSFRSWGYLVRDHDITVRHGVVLRSVTSVPFNRVQHASVSSGPIERWLGLATVKVFTAGGVGADLSIAGLGAIEAAALQDLILANVAVTGPSTSPPTTDG